MPIIVGDVIRLQQIIRADGVNMVVGAAYQLSDAGSTSNDQELMNSLVTDNWSAVFMDIIWDAANDVDVVATCIKAQKILPTREDDFIFIQNIAGLLGPDHLPVHASVMITKTSKSTGPGSSGRSFFPAPPEQHFTGGHLNEAGALLWNPVANFLNDDLTAGAFGTTWKPQHVRNGSSSSDVFRTWVNPNIRTIRSRQAVDCPV